MHAGLFARGTANLAPHHGLRARWIHHAVVGQGSLRHHIHSSKTSIWHPLEQLCLGRVKGFGKTTLRLLKTHGESSPPSWALSHHFLHCHWCTKDPQPNLLSRGRLPNPCLFPMQQPDQLVSEHPPCSPRPHQPQPWLAVKPLGEAASIHPVPPHWCHPEHYPDKVN